MTNIADQKMMTVHVCSDEAWARIAEACAFDPKVAVYDIANANFFQEELVRKETELSIEARLLDPLLSRDAVAIHAKAFADRTAAFLKTDDARLHVRAHSFVQMLFTMLAFQSKQVLTCECTAACCVVEVLATDVIWPAGPTN